MASTDVPVLALSAVLPDARNARVGHPGNFGGVDYSIFLSRRLRARIRGAGFRNLWITGQQRDVFFDTFHYCAGVQTDK